LLVAGCWLLVKKVILALFCNFLPIYFSGFCD